MNYLNRTQAAFAESLWEEIDQATASAASDILTARRFLDMDGPYGVGLTSIERHPEQHCHRGEAEAADMVASHAISLPMLRRSFGLSVRRIESHLEMGKPLDLTPAEDAAEAVARREEALIYYGYPDCGLEGLLTAKDRHERSHGDWSQVERALDDVLGAVNALDEDGFHGPYALALAPDLYNNLFRRYEGTAMLQLEHLRRLCEIGVFKAPIQGAVLVDPHAGQIIVGQDLVTGYTSNDGIYHRLFVSESLVLRVDDPGAICSLTATT